MHCAELPSDKCQQNDIGPSGSDRPERRASPMGAESALPFACKMVSHADHAGVRRLPILQLLWAGLRSVYRLQENL